MSRMDWIRRQRHNGQRAVDDAHDAVALQALAPLAGEFLPWTSFSMRPSAILGVLNDTLIQQRRNIVECGSGNSTVFCARLLSRLGGGHITSIDHDADWAELTARNLRREGLDEHVTVIHAPLTAGWYDVRSIPELQSIDLLVVDGPPAWRPEDRLARRRAAEHFAPVLTGDATIVLDDARRRGEREVITGWERKLDRTFRLQRGGYSISAPYIS